MGKHFEFVIRGGQERGYAVVVEGFSGRLRAAAALEIEYQQSDLCLEGGGAEVGRRWKGHNWQELTMNRLAKQRLRDL